MTLIAKKLADERPQAQRAHGVAGEEQRPSGDHPGDLGFSHLQGGLPQVHAPQDPGEAPGGQRQDKSDLEAHLAGPRAERLQADEGVLNRLRVL